MKKILYILFLISAFCVGQEIVRPAKDYYSADSIRNRTDAFRSSADAVKKWAELGFPEMEVDLYQPTLKYRFPKINSNVVKTYKDSIITAKLLGALITVNHETGKYTYTFTGVDDNHTPFKVSIDSIIVKKIQRRDSTTIKTKDLLLNVRYNYINGFELAEKSVVGLPFQILWYEYPEGLKDKELTIQAFSNAPSECYSRLWKQGTMPPEWGKIKSDNPGNPYEGIWRHTQIFKPEDIGEVPVVGDIYYAQIKEISLLDGSEYVGRVISFMIK